LAGYDIKIVYCPGNLHRMLDGLFRRPDYHPEKGDRGDNRPQQISVVLKRNHFISELMLKDIAVQIVTLGSKLHAVSPSEFNIDLMERIVTAATYNQEWQQADNEAKDCNPSTNIEYLYRALYY
jgi:predicted HTH domain antitoxin